MNIAFPAVLIALIALPGMVLRYTFLTGTITSPFEKASLGEQISWGVGLAAFLHSIWVPTAHLVGHPVDLGAVLTLLAGQRSSAFDEAVYAATHGDAPKWILIYFATINATAFFGGHLGHRVVRGFRLDWSHRIFRFDNPWWYLLTGERLHLRREEIQHPASDFFVVISAVVDQGSESFVYEGILRAFRFSPNGDLEHLELSQAHRRPLDDDEQRKLYRVPGNYFVLKYAATKEISIRYVRGTYEYSARPGGRSSPGATQSRPHPHSAEPEPHLPEHL